MKLSSTTIAGRRLCGDERTGISPIPICDMVTNATAFHYPGGRL
jgi:hypothetical protein